MPSPDDTSPRDRRPVLTPLPGEGDLGLVDALAQLTFAVQGALARIAAEYDVSVPAARLLGIVRDRQPTIGELATFLQLDKSSVTGLVDRAAERGLVVRPPRRSTGAASGSRSPPRAVSSSTRGRRRSSRRSRSWRLT
jgi:hypothetical protein